MLEMNEFNNWVIKNTFSEIANKITSTNKIKKKTTTPSKQFQILIK